MSSELSSVRPYTESFNPSASTWSMPYQCFQIFVSFILKSAERSIILIFLFKKCLAFFIEIPWGVAKKITSQSKKTSSSGSIKTRLEPSINSETFEPASSRELTAIKSVLSWNERNLISSSPA